MTVQSVPSSPVLGSLQSSLPGDRRKTRPLMSG